MSPALGNREVVRHARASSRPSAFSPRAHTSPRPRPLTLALGALFALGAVSCAPDLRPDEGGAVGVGEGSSAIVGSDLSPASEDAVVLVRNVRGDCTGTLVAPNLVVTARHCVAPGNLTMRCTERGETLSGGEPGADYDPAKIAIYTGNTLARAGALDPKAVGKQIVHDGAARLCDHDVAFIVLSNDVAGPVAKVRLTTPPAVGETVRAVGWGLSTSATAPDTRTSRGGVRITGVGANRATTSGPHELTATEGLCDGDSGGPALSERDGAILGVGTRGGSARAAQLTSPEACRGDDIVNVYVSLAAHAKTVQAAFRAAGRPEPEAPPDDPCATAKCAAGTTCVVRSGAATCEAPATNEPPASEGCVAARPPTATRSGGVPMVTLGLALGVAAFVRRRRPAK